MCIDTNADNFIRNPYFITRSEYKPNFCQSTTIKSWHMIQHLKYMYNEIYFYGYHRKPLKTKKKNTYR